MNKDDRQRASLDFALIYESLLFSMNQAGGMVHSIKRLTSMTAFDLLCELGPNNIRFCCTPGTGDSK